MYKVQAEQPGEDRREDEEASSRQNSGGAVAHLKGKANSSVLEFAEGLINSEGRAVGRNLYHSIELRGAVIVLSVNFSKI